MAVGDSIVLGFDLAQVPAPVPQCQVKDRVNRHGSPTRIAPRPHVLFYSGGGFRVHGYLVIHSHTP